MENWQSAVPLLVLFTSTYALLAAIGKYFRGPAETARDRFGWSLEVVGAASAGIVGMVVVVCTWGWWPMGVVGLVGVALLLSFTILVAFASTRINHPGTRFRQLTPEGVGFLRWIRRRLTKAKGGP